MTSGKTNTVRTYTSEGVDEKMPRQMVLIETSIDYYDKDEIIRPDQSDMIKVESLVINGQYYVATDVFYCSVACRNHRIRCEHEECSKFSNAKGVNSDDLSDWLKEVSR